MFTCKLICCLSQNLQWIQVLSVFAISPPFLLLNQNLCLLLLWKIQWCHYSNPLSINLEVGGQFSLVARPSSSRPIFFLLIRSLYWMFGHKVISYCACNCFHDEWRHASYQFPIKESIYTLWFCTAWQLVMLLKLIMLAICELFPWNQNFNKSVKFIAHKIICTAWYGICTSIYVQYYEKATCSQQPCYIHVVYTGSGCMVGNLKLHIGNTAWQE